ncbi:TPA: hypothetical protein ACKRI4_000933 [Proteus mirabilis]|nr:hypothetical protein [Proteus mirabilis]
MWGLIALIAILFVSVGYFNNPSRPGYGKVSRKIKNIYNQSVGASEARKRVTGINSKMNNSHQMNNSKDAHTTRKNEK